MAMSAKALTAVDEGRENARAGEITEEAREHRVAISDKRSNEQQFSCALADVGNSRSHQTHDDERYEERQEMAEDAVEGDKAPHSPLGEEHAAQHAEDDGDDDAWQQAYFGQFHVI